MTDPTPSHPETSATDPTSEQPNAAPVVPAETVAASAAAQPVRKALHEALREVDSQEKADAVIEELAAASAGQTTQDVAQSQPPTSTPKQAAQQVKQAAEHAPEGEKAQQVLTETARVLATPPSPGRDVVAQAAQDVLNPEQQGAPTVAGATQREYLRRAVIKRLKPFDAFDTDLFLKINHLPHTRWLNGFFSFVTLIFTGGAAWYVLMGLITLRKPRLGWTIIRRSALPLAIATALVEYPIKAYFRRRRPFISIIQAVVIGQKPGSWSFPSGHSATAFAGAWLFSRHLRRGKKIFYLIASLVAFSRIYLGAHYPGDVVVGSALGAFFALLCARLPWWRTDKRGAQKPTARQ